MCNLINAHTRLHIQTPTINQQPKPKDPTPHRDRLIDPREGRMAKDRIAESRGGAKKRKKIHKRYKRDMENGGDSGDGKKNVDNDVMVH